MAQKNSKNQRKLFFGVAFSAIAVLLILIFGNSKKNYIAESAENIFYDQFFKLNTEVLDSTGIKDGIVLESKPYNDPNIIIADIDEKSLLKLGHYYNWDRSIHAKVIENLGEGGAAAIAFDILFKDADPIQAMPITSRKSVLSTTTTPCWSNPLAIQASALSAS